MQGMKMQHSNSKTLFFGKHLQEFVAIAYFQWPVNRKQEKRCEFFTMVYPHTYLWFQASYAPAADDV